MKRLAVLALTLAPLAAGCNRAAGAEVATDDGRMEIVSPDGDSVHLTPDMAALEGDPMNIVPETQAGLWRVTVMRDGKRTSVRETCEKPQNVRELMVHYGHPPACTKRTFKKTGSTSYTYKATCDMFGDAYIIDNQISGDMVKRYTLNLRRTKHSKKYGQSFEGIVETGERLGDCK